ncbi:MAG: cobalt-precorrin 5A hydrolase [Eubacteriales bacterium]|jgi:cobalt-precorrin 5A hydrolase
MKAAVICFTKEGYVLAGRIMEALDHLRSEQKHIDAEYYGKGKYVHDLCDMDDSYVKYVEKPVQDWAGECFETCDLMIFIGAAGIAVRAIAPFVRDKRTDPAVIVMDEKGKFCISLLSGHIGGANKFVRYLSSKLGSIPVVTTATDSSNRFSVDTYAVEHDMQISNMTYAKEVSAAILAGEPVGFHTNFEVEGSLPEGVYWSDKLGQEQGDKAEDQNGTSLGIYISPSYNRAYFDHTLWLIPRCLTLGIGCKKGTPFSKIEKLVDDTMREYSLYTEAIEAVASIDVKKDEPGLLHFCRVHNVPFHTYSAEELKKLNGSFTRSDFVEETIGVDNVCERSAVIDKHGDLIIRKKAADGVTLAVALNRRVIRF